MRVVIGIDPGAGGGIGIVIPGTAVGNTVMEIDYDRKVIKMPTTEAELVGFFQHASRYSPYVFMEKLAAMPPMFRGSLGNWGLGMQYGSIKTALAAAGLLDRVQFVRPQEWQKALGCLTKGDKKVSKKKAEAMFPNLTITHATADALLIAEFGRRVVSGEITRHETATVAPKGRKPSKAKSKDRKTQTSKNVRSVNRSSKTLSRSKASRKRAA